MEIIHTDVLVVGGGLAGLRAALAARQRGQQVIVLSLVPAKRRLRFDQKLFEAGARLFSPLL